MTGRFSNSSGFASTADSATESPAGIGDPKRRGEFAAALGSADGSASGAGRGDSFERHPAAERAKAIHERQSVTAGKRI
jgi:hypothetical protein